MSEDSLKELFEDLDYSSSELMVYCTPPCYGFFFFEWKFVIASSVCISMLTPGRFCNPNSLNP
jgi:hypothetical protein